MRRWIFDFSQRQAWEYLAAFVAFIAGAAGFQLWLGHKPSGIEDLAIVLPLTAVAIQARVASQMLEPNPVVEEGIWRLIRWGMYTTALMFGLGLPDAIRSLVARRS